MTRLFTSIATALLTLAGAAAAQGLTLWTPVEGEALDWLRAETEAFTELFDVAVEVERLDLATLQQRALRAEEEAAADVFAGLDHTAVRPLAEADVLADLRTVATGAYLEDVSAPARSAFTQEGRLVGLPLAVEGPALVYARRQLDAVPEDYPALLARARALTGENRYGFLADVGNFYYAYAWLATHGGYVFAHEDGDWNTEQVGFDTDGAFEGAAALRALRFEHELVPAEADYDFAARRFLQGRVAMFYTGPWFLDSARSSGLEVGVAPMPPLADGRPWRGFMSATGVALNAHGERQRDAANLAKWLVRREAQVELAASQDRVPASWRAVERLDEGDPLRGFAEALRHAQPVPGVDAMGRVWGPAARMLEAVTGDVEVEVASALQRAAEEVRAP